MAPQPAIAVIDIGKSNAKLAVVDAATRKAIEVRTIGVPSVPGGRYLHYDTERIWQWLLQGLAAFAPRAEISAISVTTHGACFALLAGDELAMPILDYEDHGPEEMRAAYAAARGPFSETLSPDLPDGLNAGRQIFWQSRTFPDAFAKVDAILPYPQYWVWRLTGAKAAEATSLGCHTDLWNPRAGTYSELAVREGWDRKFPPLVHPWATVGTLLPEVAQRTGLDVSCRVVAGIHDSNASLYPHLLARPLPFAVLSTGTWMVVFAPGGSLDALDPNRDCLANVDAFGRAVPSSRFMAGREYESLADLAQEPSQHDMERVVSGRVMALPTFARGTGPFGTRAGRWTVDVETLSVGERAAAAALYATLVTEACLTLTDAGGPVIVEGPFARNAAFLSALAQRVARPVLARPDATGTTEGAALLTDGPAAKVPKVEGDTIAPLPIDLAGYARQWRSLASADA